MLAYFPQVYPGELLYSVLARYHRHMGAPSTIHSIEALFGRRLTVANIDLPGSLQALADRIPAGAGWTADRIVDDLTLLPYYMAFQSVRVARQARQAMLEGQTNGLLVRLGMAAFRVRRVTRLRFCTTCLQEMQARYGEYYWCRDHQLPGVFVCPEHGQVLQLSTTSVSEQGRHCYVPATRKSCPWHAPALVSDLVDSTASALRRLAQASSALLVRPERQRSFVQWARHYRESLGSAGFARSSRHIDQQQLQEAFWCHYQNVWPWLPELVDGQRFRGDWLATLTRKHRKAFHPLLHLLLQDFIDHQESASGLFGKGPWSCLNPLAEHQGRAVITQVRTHCNRDHRVGVFACRCGYTYTRSWFAGSKGLGSPRFQSYGPLLAPVLKDMISRGQSLRAVARRLELDPKTVVKLAVGLGISISWKVQSGQERKRVCTLDRPSQIEVREIPIRQRRGCIRFRTNWDALDLEVCRKIRNAARQLHALVPPVRITPARIERMLWTRGWLGKRIFRLPLADACAQEVTESIEKFQRRRADWVIRQMDGAGEPLQVWRVLRKAGLTSRHEDMVIRLLAQHFDARRTAA